MHDVFKSVMRYASSEADVQIALASISLAEKLLIAANNAMTSQEKTASRQFARMMDDDNGRAFTFAMIDEVFRSHSHELQAKKLRELLSIYHTPDYLSKLDQLLMWVAGVGSFIAPDIVMPMMERHMRADAQRVILDSEQVKLDMYLSGRMADGFTVNLNHLGEAVLGEAEAQRRLAIVLEHLKNPNVNYMSVKISAIYSQISLTAWDASISEIKDRLRILYRAAKDKFINLDMEAYQDLEMTVEAFQQVLDEDEFLTQSAGLALQGYIPDSWLYQQRITEWAMRRVERGGAPIKIRIVKGANLNMEQLEAELMGWEQAPYFSKAETDANYRRMVDYGMTPEHARAVRLGVASHNLFDVALALTLRKERGVEQFVEIEMLEGMANHQARVVKELAGGVLFYSPIIEEKDFVSAMAYLVRRLDENTAEGNFLRELFGLVPGNDRWEKEKEKFLVGWYGREQAGKVSQRGVLPEVKEDTFYNEPNTDWTQVTAREAMAESIAARKAIEVSCDLQPVNEVIRIADKSQPSWEALGWDARSEIILRAADVMQRDRFKTLALMQMEGNKAIKEADPEVSEAIDFCRYYARYQPNENQTHEALGVVTITPPWNFPYAIPCGGIVAALMAGNSVILKPAPQVRGIAQYLCEQLWEAGVPQNVLQFYPCGDDENGKQLIIDERVQAVVLTGAYETAQMFLGWRPDLRLYAETSGKNAMIITAQADRDLAVRDLVRSAFGHSGQKCSAASLAIVEAEVYDDPAFQQQLVDAVASLHVGPATDLQSVITPLLLEPEKKLQRALTELETGESWALTPQQMSNDGKLWSPGVKLGIEPGSWFHMNECFGPVLGLMRAESFESAVYFQNMPEYGLTAGLHSLDEEEQTYWLEHVQAGNCYINRGTTGAIVNRQPFGGWKKSCVGPGLKAGGPDYVGLFLNSRDEVDAGASQDELLVRAKASYQDAWENHYSQVHELAGLQGESNVLRYRPKACIDVIVDSRTAEGMFWKQCAIYICEMIGVKFNLYDRGDPLFYENLRADFEAEYDGSPPTSFLRLLCPIEDSILDEYRYEDVKVFREPISCDGMVELKYWLREQSVSKTEHRYGLINPRPHD